MKGIILAGDSGSRLHPLTLGVPKQLLPVFDKPMIYYPIQTLIDAGIKDILIITSPLHAQSFISALGDGSSFNANFTYATQCTSEGVAQAFTIGETFMNDSPVCLITGDCIIMGNDRAAMLQKSFKAAKKSGQATIFVCRECSPEQYGVVEIDKYGNRLSVKGKPSPTSRYSIIGLYIFPQGVANYAKVIEKSERGRYEVTTLNQIYLEENKLQVQILGRDYKWFDTNTFENLLKLSNYIHNKQLTDKRW